MNKRDVEKLLDACITNAKKDIPFILEKKTGIKNSKRFKNIKSLEIETP